MRKRTSSMSGNRRMLEIMYIIQAGRDGPYAHESHSSSSNSFACFFCEEVTGTVAFGGETTVVAAAGLSDFTVSVDSTNDSASDWVEGAPVSSNSASQLSPETEKRHMPPAETIQSVFSHLYHFLFGRRSVPPVRSEGQRPEAFERQ